MEFKCQAFTSLEQFARQSKFDAALAFPFRRSSPGRCKTLMEAGIDVLIEKPVAVTLQEPMN